MSPGETEPAPGGQVVWTRRVRGFLVLVALQGALVSGYLLLEADRRETSPFLHEALDEPAPEARFEARDGVVDLAGSGPVLVHFWATWCAPCRKELPGLLEASRETGATVVAVTDEEWLVVDAFFGGAVPDEIARDAGGLAARAFRVSTLPDTFLLEGGRIVGRAGGARDWEGEDARSWLRRLERPGRNE